MDSSTTEEQTSRLIDSLFGAFTRSDSLTPEHWAKIIEEVLLIINRELGTFPLFGPLELGLHTFNTHQHLIEKEDIGNYTQPQHLTCLNGLKPKVRCAQIAIFSNYGSSHPERIWRLLLTQTGNFLVWEHPPFGFTKYKGARGILRKLPIQELPAFMDEGGCNPAQIVGNRYNSLLNSLLCMCGENLRAREESAAKIRKVTDRVSRIRELIHH